MELSPQERERVYLEEKARREESGSSMSLLLLNLVALAGLVGVFYLTNKLKERGVSVDDLRRAYSGLGPDDDVE